MHETDRNGTMYVSDEGIDSATIEYPDLRSMVAREQRNAAVRARRLATRVLGGPVRLTRSEDCHTYHHQWTFRAI